MTAEYDEGSRGAAGQKKSTTGKALEQKRLTLGPIYEQEAGRTKI